MPFGIPSEDFHGGFGLPDHTTTDVADNEEQERLLTELLIKVGVTWHPRDKARALISRGVFIRK